MGHCAPYVAVITLSVMTAHHWRVMRLKMVQAGIRNPMKLPTMHILLDATEAAILESIAMSGERDAEMRRSLFLDKLYSPMADTAGLNGEEYEGRPSGFADDDVEASFDAFAAAAG